eukprot:CAMPEP_0174927062 /NCGR_PEP_ID=MMETSP1355-20121228/17691_1 /TAXON_ID=464990 /ORGANISM="Hemiselmis tepida, Strain CCMP443" /LENGTH=173 /DNA_ID=CAMNT_0016173145 /DNA_START=38 /DNA_END=556 /DNA_ORIENTATION=-
MAYQSPVPFMNTTLKDAGIPGLETKPFGPRAKISYEVKVTTGDVSGGGTNAAVFLTLHGTKGDSKRTQLANNGERNFQRGNTDTFTLRELDLGAIESLTISHDGHSGFSERFDPAWYLEKVTVRAAKHHWAFPCRRWLAKDREDGRTKRTLYSRTAEEKISYKFTVFTGDRAG